MEIILMFVAGMIVFIIAVMAILKGVTHRIKAPTDDLNNKISNFEKRVIDLENKKDST